jgi:xanthine dehydrogenase YagR molybdenum-binding subunit
VGSTCGNSATYEQRLTPLDLPRGEDVRAPGEAPGLLAVESAMDELADALEMDPVELRIRNEPELDPERGVPFSDRHLVDCLREGTRRFGWERRPTQPASLRDRRWLVGYGMAAAISAHLQGQTNAVVRLGPDGAAVVRTDMTDIGTGTYTILTPGRGRRARTASRSCAGRARKFRVPDQHGVRRLVGRR